MYIYNVTVKVENHRVTEWIDWMKKIHIPAVLATGYFVENKFCRLLDDGDPDGETFAIQYSFKLLEDYASYKLNSATELQEATKTKFGNDFISFRTILEVI